MRCPNFYCSASRVPSTFFLRAKRRKFDRSLFPGFRAGLGLRALYELQQTAGAPAEIDVIAGGEFSWFRQKTVRIHRVENQLPFEILLTREDKRDRFIMSINQQQKCTVADGFALKTDNVDRRNFGRRNAGCALRNQISFRVKSRNWFCFSSRVQSNQLISLS